MSMFPLVNELCVSEQSVLVKCRRD